MGRVKLPRFCKVCGVAIPGKVDHLLCHKHKLEYRREKRREHEARLKVSGRDRRVRERLPRKKSGLPTFNPHRLITDQEFEYNITMMNELLFSKYRLENFESNYIDRFIDL